MNWQYRPLGEILVKKGLISEENMNIALKNQEEMGNPLGEILVERKLISEAQLAKALAEQKHLDVIDLSEITLNPRAYLLISKKMALKYQLIPIDFLEDKLLVATANPLDIQALDNIRMITGYQVVPRVSTLSNIRDTINQFMPNEASIGEIVNMTAEEVGIEDEQAAADDTPIVRLANSIIAESIRRRASDIHIEPGERDVAIRFRIDGVMQEHTRIPKKLLNPLVSRLKILSDINIAEKRLPQDGRASLVIDGRAVDIRMATLPSINGENLNMRILERGKHAFTLTDLGMEAELLDQYRKCFARTYGSVLVTGPTGSGKTTTLYATLSEINSPEKKIITIEDPVERKLDGITQSQINIKSGLTFATGLRAIVRHDPDIVMVGEIRDLETAKIAIRAALTGHLVLSTLHTNDAAAAITRLTDMGIEPFLVASSIRSILAQRLARRLCNDCKEPYTLEVTDVMRAFDIPEGEKEIVFYHSVGCRKCNNTGYLGRIAVLELLMITEEISKLCLSRASSREIHQMAISQGMRSLRQDAFRKARTGVTSLEEISRVLV